MAGVEADRELAPYLANGNAFRLLDDFSIGFGSEAEAKNGLRALRHALWKYNLQLNDEKTRIKSSHVIFRDKWKLDFDKVVVAAGDHYQQLRDIDHLVDLALYHCHQTGTAMPAQWACRRLGKVAILDENLEASLDSMFRLARDFPICINYVASFLINNQERCTSPKLKDRIKDWISSILLLHLPQAHHFEVAWSLVVAGVLRIKLTAGDFPVDGNFPGSIVLSLIGLLIERKLIDVKLSNWDWRARLHKQGALGENWLLHYEAVRRKWTRDAKLKSQIQQHPVLALALAENVPFLRDDILDARVINLDKRTFRPKLGATPGTNSHPSVRRGPTLAAYKNDDDDEAEDDDDEELEY